MKKNQRRLCTGIEAKRIFTLEKQKYVALCQISSLDDQMRKIFNAQMQMGGIDINDIKIELNNRDEIPQLLRGLQFVYRNKKVRNLIFRELSTVLPDEIDKNTGREGMTLWRMFVLGVLRVNCNWDYDKLQEIANNHYTLRQFLGHGMADFHERYHRTTLNDNLRYFTPNVLDKINTIIVDAGITLVKKVDISKTEHGRCDSFVLETDVHFPTDLNLLWDAARVAMRKSYKLSNVFSISGWRQTPHNLKMIKKLYRATQRERDRNKDSDACLHATQQYIDLANEHLDRAEQLAKSPKITNHILYSGVAETIIRFVDQGRKQISQIYRRVFKGETILHKEKVFSLFEDHTEWISKGKAGVPQELGLRVCILESSTGFILHHKVMEKETDDSVAVEMVENTQKKFPFLRSCSFDKGFHSPQNQVTLAEKLESCVLPRKGKLGVDAKVWEGSEEFKEKRRIHSAVESAINAIENHGLDRCCDHGIKGFKRYVAYAVVARNLQLIGAMLRKEEIESFKKTHKKAA